MKLKAWRGAAEMRQQDLAPKIGVTVNRLSDIERGTVWPNPVEIAMIQEFTSGWDQRIPPVTLADLYETWHARNPEAMSDFRAGLAAAG